MASENLIKTFQSYENYIATNGIDTQALQAMVYAVGTAFDVEKDREYGLKISQKTKKAIEQFAFRQTNGGDLWALEKFCFEHDTRFEILDLWYDVLKHEAQNRVFDSYLMYLERKRIPKERFYMPKRKQLMKIGIVDALQDMLDDKADILCFSLPPGTGKAQPLYSKVLTPNGFAHMGDIKVGDTVISGTGKASKVLGVYPQGIKPIYEITLDDGSKCRCSDEHLWQVQTIEDRERYHRYRVIELKGMLENYKRGCRSNYSIDYAKNVEFNKKELPIHPYVLGMLLGDGCFSGRSGIGFATADEEIVNKMQQCLPKGYSVVKYAKYNYGIKAGLHGGTGKKSSLRVCLENLGLFGLHSEEKFIPSEYIYSSREDRLELLRGLLDSDGYASKSSCAIEFASTSKRLTKGVIEVVRSLGGYASYSVKKNRTYKGKDGKKVMAKDAHIAIIYFISEKENPFFVQRKADLFRAKMRGRKRLIKQIEYVGEEECQCIYIDDPSHLYITDDYIITHNTTMSKFFISGVIGWFPKDFNLFFSHSNDIARMYYDGVNNIISDFGEYAWGEIFPDIKITNTNAKAQTLNVGKYKPFASLQCTSRSSNNAGVVRASKFLMVDDLVAGIEEALNKQTLEKLWNIYTVDARQRKIDGCKEIHIATRWSTVDVIGRLMASYPSSERVRYISIPDIDEKTGESNFDYEYGGFTVDFFNDQKKLMDEISYKCLYKQQPIEREGLLYHEDELRRYVSLPEEKPDAVLAICDTKTTGIDYMFLPVFYQYDNDFYLVDCICDNSTDFNVQINRIVDILVHHGVQKIEFESNAGGSRLAFDVENELSDRGYTFCSITTKPTETNKETRIIVNADWIKKQCLFKIKESYSEQSDYGRMMSFLLGYSIAGKNTHDDVPDGMANFRLFVENLYETHVARIIKSPI